MSHKKTFSGNNVKIKEHTEKNMMAVVMKA